MTKRKDIPPPATTDKTGTLRIASEAGVDQSTMLARTALRPSVRAAVTVQTYSKQFGELDLTALVAELSSQITAVNDGDMRRTEAMLAAQAHTLEAIFHELMRRAGLNMREYLGAAETYMRLGLKAQSQCRATIETLAEIKNPKPVAFVQQANIANGPQQVNNGPPPAVEPSRARESENQPNKLLEQQRNEWLDAGTSQAAGSRNSSVEAVGAIHGSKDDRG